MDIEKLRKQLEIDEGVKYEIYNDHLGYPTFGIGHLVIPSDKEGYPENHRDWDKDIRRKIVANMMFNMRII